MKVLSMILPWASQFVLGEVNENNGMQAILEDGQAVSAVKDMQLLDDFIPVKGKLGLREHVL
ncbi:hypothetical protein ACQKKK_18560 [Peribacillus sp. NPDC006672]|uniref:hypothetical protein n=1 Tax=Peribacillus sp. NPDC006672 TaxID=3390606 RepID=UPI003CFC7833